MLSVAANVDLEQIQGIEVEPAEGPEDPGFGFRAEDFPVEALGTGKSEAQIFVDCLHR